MSKKNNYLLVTLLLFSSFFNLMVAQSSSPYNRYGIGNLYSNATSNNRAMGGVSAAFSNPYGINIQNPASLSEIFLTTYDAGMEGESVRSFSKDSSYRASSSGFSHLAIAFPVKLGTWGASLSFKPYSSVRYNFKKTVNGEQIGEYAEFYTGSGNTYQFMVGNGVRYKGFSLGVNLGVLFGHIEYNKTVVFKDDVFALPTRYSSEVTVRGFLYNIGAQYKYRLPLKKKDKNIFAIFGVYGSSANKENTSSINHWERFDLSGSTARIVDTVGSVQNEKGKINMPGSVTGGVAFEQSGKWFIGTDIKHTNWSAYTTSLNNASYANNIRWSLGGEICPDKSAKKNVFSYMVYRLGFYTGTSEFFIGGRQLKETGATAGFGIPLRSKDGGQFSMFNFAFEFKTRGINTDGLLRENFYKFNLSFVFNDRWFLKRRFD
jgi:hypothetical protein